MHGRMVSAVGGERLGLGVQTLDDVMRDPDTGAPVSAEPLPQRCASRGALRSHAPLARPARRLLRAGGQIRARAGEGSEAGGQAAPPKKRCVLPCMAALVAVCGTARVRALTPVVVVVALAAAGRRAQALLSGAGSTRAPGAPALPSHECGRGRKRPSCGGRGCAQWWQW
jgi:hypothetical protein